MESSDYRVGQVHALVCLGLGKFASIPADQTTVGKALAAGKDQSARLLGAGKGQGTKLLGAVKDKMPKTPLGRAATLGATIGLGMGAYKVNKDSHMGTQMENPLIAQRSPARIY